MNKQAWVVGLRLSPNNKVCEIGIFGTFEEMAAEVEIYRSGGCRLVYISQVAAEPAQAAQRPAGTI